MLMSPNLFWQHCRFVTWVVEIARRPKNMMFQSGFSLLTCCRWAEQSIKIVNRPQA